MKLLLLFVLAGVLAGQSVPDTPSRIAALEKRVAELLSRIERLECLQLNPVEHEKAYKKPPDRLMVPTPHPDPDNPLGFAVVETTPCAANETEIYKQDGTYCAPIRWCRQ